MRLSGYLACILVIAVPCARGQLFSNLQALVYQIPVGDPHLRGPAEGPKGIATADLDGDGMEDLAVSNTDGTVTVYFGRGGGRFSQPLHLRTGVKSLRGIVCGDLNGDGLPDIATAAPYQSQIFIFLNTGQRSFAPPVALSAWYGVRNLALGDFDGDGLLDLVAGGPNNGVRQLRNLGAATFAEVTNIAALSFSFSDQSKFPKPVYSFAVYREVGATVDSVAATHAETNRVWLLRNSSGVLEVRGVLTNRATAHALAIGELLRPRGAWPDLITVARDAGTLEIHAGTWDGFDPAVAQRIDVPGGPRAIQIVDLNGDGWNDLVVVQRNFDSIVTFVNSNGVFQLATERPVGTSPRELVAPRLDDDDFPDVAVMNRQSSDLSILLASPHDAGYRGVNHLYLVDGNVAGLMVSDFNGDGRADVIQLHRSSGDFSVRLANSDGTLRAPIYYTVGNVPAAQVFADVNNDGIRDQITANLGTIGIEKGSVSVRLGTRFGTFGPERRFQLPDDVDGRLFALVPVDLDRDGNIDLAAGFLGSRIAFFQGLGNGDFRFTRAHSFVAQSRALLAGDFDHDGDADLVGVGASGEIWVVENRGDLLTTVALTVQKLPAPTNSTFSIRNVILTDHDGDGDLDLIVGSSSGALLYRGQPGLSFSFPPEELAGTAFSVADVLLADLDQDGKKDLVMSCRENDCISIFTPTADGTFAYASTLDAPASKFLATGDLDGDGKPDLVGTGRILWTALSGHPPQPTPPLALVGSRVARQTMVINEILALNTELKVDSDSDHVVDWVELYNGSSLSTPLYGWHLRLLSVDGAGLPSTNDFAFPATAFMSPGKHLLVYFSTTRRTSYHTGFKLPANGGTLVLVNAAGTEVDRVEYPTQQENVSYARFRDGLYAFAFNPFPSPGKPNVPNGRVQPNFHFRGVEPSTFLPGAAMRFFAEAEHEVGISSVTMYYQRLDQPESSVQRVELFDDGLHGDGAPGDGLFATDVEGSFPTGSELQFYFEVTDLDDEVMQVPDEPDFGLPGEPGNAYQLALAATRPPLEISEVVSFNDSSLFDETGGTPDWVEVRNTSTEPRLMDGISLSHDLGDSARFYWPSGTVLNPGEHFVVYCDDNPREGPLHAPFHLTRANDMLVLSGLTTNKSRTLIDWTRFGPLEPDNAWARMGVGGHFRIVAPTPRACNVPGSVLTYLDAGGGEPSFNFVFPTTTNATYVVEQAPALNSPSSWYQVQSISGDGIEKVISLPSEGLGFFRVKKMP